ncbi:hypothetical protein HNR60_001618 [Rhodopseudomonas rhenobacensis]|uniref:Uncharacterized protein n=1 Tax=Rhodopseudomonas rhenobacensis TaxID=87461 RepID=A0A7W7Z2Q4_9BRAD|nr:hypothetical protein [Rhodopseudomonas rhenobacensis]MBB5046869.1 hypothetical protein [Rhodopseudomonas rhenobacensis]
MATYICLPRIVTGGLFPLFARDPNVRALRDGTRVGLLAVVDRQSAAEIFALRRARRRYGYKARVRFCASDSVIDERRELFRARLESGDGSDGEEIRFAVVTSETIDR